MDNNQYLKIAQNAAIRCAIILDSSIGEVYNNEALILQNDGLKTAYSLRLNMSAAYDKPISFVPYCVKNEGFRPLEIILRDSYADIDYYYKVSERRKVVKDFIKNDGFLSDENRKKLIEIIRNAREEAKELFKGSASADFERLAYKYQKIMKSGIDYQNLGIVARLDLYASLLELDDRYTAMNFEEPMFIRREELISAINEESHERLSAFIAECVLDAATRASDILEDLKIKGNFAAHFLSMKMEKGKEYSIEELSILFGISKDMLRALILIPALSSDQVSLTEVGEDEAIITLIG